jgi:hypothetical protein
MRGKLRTENHAPCACGTTGKRYLRLVETNILIRKRCLINEPMTQNIKASGYRQQLGIKSRLGHLHRTMHYFENSRVFNGPTITIIVSTVMLTLNRFIDGA